MPPPERRVAQPIVRPHEERAETERQIGRLVSSEAYIQLESQKRRRLVLWQRLCLSAVALLVVLLVGATAAALYARQEFLRQELERDELHRLLAAYHKQNASMKERLARQEQEKRQCEEQLESRDVPLTEAFSIETPNTTGKCLEDVSREAFEEEIHEEEAVVEADVRFVDPPAPNPTKQTKPLLTSRYLFMEADAVLVCALHHLSALEGSFSRRMSLNSETVRAAITIGGELDVLSVESELSRRRGNVFSDVAMENVVRDVGPSNHSCGYCDCFNGFFSHGMTASQLTVQAYQDLLDVGWRRSGTYLYKPDLSRMCCPNYTIRLNVDAFVPCKSQTKTLRRFQNYLNGGALSAQFKREIAKPSPTTPAAQPSALFMRLLRDLIANWLHQQDLPQVEVEVTIGPPSPKQRKLLSKAVFLTSPVCLSLFYALKRSLGRESQFASPDALADSFCQYATHTCPTLYHEHFTPEQQSQWEALFQGISLHHLKGYLNFEHTQNAALDPTVTLELLSGLPVEETEPMETTSEDGEDIPHELPSLPDHFCRPQSKSRKFTTTLIRSSYLEEEYELYKKYQMTVHGDTPYRCSISQYKRFLVHTPLIYQPATEEVPEMGSFHMQYRIDGHLVGVGVLDVLPRCVSSKYFFWDPEFAPLALGKVSALKEIEWVQALHRISPSLQYYYMGFYIQSCPKMRYKGDYAPSELLCPISYRWVQLTDVVKACLEDHAFLDLSAIPDVETQPNHVSTSEDEGGLEQQRVRVGDEILSLGDYLSRLQNSLGTSGRLMQLLGRAWRDDPRGAVNRIAAFLRETISEWRSQAKGAAQNLVYQCDVL